MKFFHKIFPVVVIGLFFGCGVKKDPEPPEKIFPMPVENLKVRVLGGCADLSWSYPGAGPLQKILILRSEAKSPDSKWTDPGQIADLTGDASFFEDCGLAPGNYYGYQVLGVSKYRQKTEDGKMARISLPRIPDRPRDFKAQSGDRFVDFNWSRQPDFVYNLYRSETGQGFPARTLNQAPVSKNRFSDINLENGKTYFYCLREVMIPEGYPAVESECALAQGSPIDLIAPLPPKGLAVARAEKGVMLKWLESPEPDLLGYLVFRRPAGAGNWKLLTAEPIKETRFLDSSAPGMKGQLEYSVRAVDNAPGRNKSDFATRETISLN